MVSMQIRIQLFISIRIRIRIHGVNPDHDQTVPLLTKSWNFYMKLYFMKVIDHKTYLRRYKTLFQRLEIRFICEF
jgi:hypothetical protein